MRLLCDVHISPRVVASLRAAGHDAVSVPDVLPASTPDAEILRLARAEQRVVVTFDLDLSHLVATGGHAAPSLIQLRLSSAHPDVVTPALTRAIEASPTGAGGWIIVVDDQRLRIRTLPIELK